MVDIPITGTYYYIGKIFNKTEKQLLEDNNITSNKEVIPGHVIKIY